MGISFSQIKALKEKYDKSSLEDLFIELKPVYDKYWASVLSSSSGIGIDTIKQYKKRQRKPSFGNYVILLSIMNDRCSSI